MILLAVIAFWLAVAGYVPFHFRKTQVLQDFVRGFCEVWGTILKAREPQPILDDSASDALKAGVATGVVSLIAIAVLIVILAAYTIYLAC